MEIMSELQRSGEVQILPRLLDMLNKLSNGQQWFKFGVYHSSFGVYLRNKKCTVFLSSYRNMSGSLGEREMLWEHEPPASVSTAFLSSPKLSRVFL